MKGVCSRDDNIYGGTVNTNREDKNMKDIQQRNATRLDGSCEEQVYRLHLSRLTITTLVG